MKPSDPNYLRKKRTATAALKRKIRIDFGWLEGAPAVEPGTAIDLKNGIPWMLFWNEKKFSPKEVSINQQQLLASLRAPVDLRHSFPRAFPNLVGNVSTWIEQHRAVPALLSKVSHLPDSLAPDFPIPERIRKSAEAITLELPSLKPLVRRLLWRAPHDPNTVRTELKLLGKIGAALTQILPVIETYEEGGRRLEMQHRLLQLSSKVPAPELVSLLELIAHPAMSAFVELGGTIPLDELSNFTTSNELNRHPFPKVEGQTQAAKLLKFAEQLSNLDKEQARFALDVFLLAYPFQLLEEVARWWQRWLELEPFLKSLYRNPNEVNRDYRNELYQRCRSLTNSLVELPVYDHAAIELASSIARHAIRRLLADVPVMLGTRICRVSLLLHYSRQSYYAKEQRRFLPFLTEFLRKRPPKEVHDLGPWSRILVQTNCYSIDEESILEVIGRTEQIRSYFEAMQVLLDDDKLMVGSAEALPALIGCGVAPPEAATLSSLIEKKCESFSDYPDSEFIPIAVKISTDHDSFVHTINSLTSLTDELYDADTQGIIALLEQIHAVGEPEIHRRLVKEKRGRTLSYLAKLLSASKAPPPAFPQASDTLAEWMERYPAEFHPSFKALRSFTSDDEAKRRATSILDKDFPDFYRMRRELEHLEAKFAESPNVGFEKRIGKLRKWIESPPATSPERLRKLAEKLGHSASEARFDYWTAQIREAAMAKLGEKMPSFADLEAWIASSQRLRHVLGIAELAPRECKHALYVIEKIRDEEMPTLFLDEPGNTDFLRKLRDKGLDPTPWIEGIGTQEIALEDRTVLKLALEDNPMELLDMGHHFGTCLSPLEFNYFSVFTNISDVNKRVVYGRVDGKVRARCLLAISEDGTILVYHPYSHGIGSDFTELITKFAESLADAMGTFVTQSGKVPTLVGPKWYDDRAIDIGTRFDFLKKGSDFRQALLNIDPDTVLERISEEISGLDPMTIPLIVALPEFYNRPSLILKMLPVIEEAEKGLAPAILLGVAEIAIKAGETNYGWRIIDRHARTEILRGGETYHHWPILHLLAQHRPSNVLGMMRKLRSRGVRSWEEDVDYHKVAVAECYYHLNRKKRARRLFESISGGINRDQKKLVARRLKEL